MRNQSEYHVEPRPQLLSAPAHQEALTVGLSLRGLRCANCVNRVRNALLDCIGVVEVEVDLATAHAEVWYRSEHVGPMGLRRVVSKAGDGTPHEYMAIPVRSLFPRTAERGNQVAIQVAEIAVESGYHPRRVFLEPGRPISLGFTRREASACSARVEFPKMEISLELPRDERVQVELGPLEPGEYPFQCGMGMIKGMLVVKSREMAA